MSYVSFRRADTAAPKVSMTRDTIFDTVHVNLLGGYSTLRLTGPSPIRTSFGCLSLGVKNPRSKSRGVTRSNDLMPRR